MLFWSWVEKTSQISTTNEKLTTALNYAKNHKEGFHTFLEDGRLVISNNLILFTEYFYPHLLQKVV